MAYDEILWSTKQLDFGDNLDHNPDPWFLVSDEAVFRGSFIYCSDSIDSQE